MAKQPTKAQLKRAAVTEAVLAAGFVAAGTTDTETVRIPTQASPVYGATGGELRTLGGRARYTKPGTNVRVTVGPQTTFVYSVSSGQVTTIAYLQTRDIEPKQLTRDLLAWSSEP